MKILLPLKYYDEAGKVKPPTALYWCALFLCRSIIIMIGAVSSKQYGNEILSLFYTEKYYLYVHLVIAIPTLVSVILIGFREKSGLTNRPWIYDLIRPLIIFSVMADFVFQVFFANLHHWQFSWVIAVTLLLDSLCFYYLAKDKHLIYMIKDWRSVTT
ncbi:DUF2919 domain-containing protein [Paraglaciecola aquimarina]|uniref:DUF2919 domain-containing protein n=1 Tax=Paraglaciecola algarum TaxID=3050085 RepID=A0ABS9D1I5_9ALTE|nr:DUF2919 domain-containing protein [Paraglaciecola sp. G1-23]MCF2946767.1 DUF2919 domain-containing protein [Paraglaciecola sp. G1-23]